ncbi:hypothetical protein QT196_29965 [Streptomyces sp. P9-2B-2]|uniref:hypothetical protein n=1 Tax=Streptomyces sp. P9-2B-2 TaxID=3057114 RepID=UPI0025B47C3F|nr:hypothetical protein [Streptomyces sp. P9-2B-2]WJY41162.1 hypothetical protein QT196_29965 [Streptomyces sp. P9-2B-2]
MQPPAWAGTADNPISAPDAFDVPVFLHRSSPLTPAPRPSPAQVASAHQPWPKGAGIPVDGAYLVGTTWRALLDATTTVGRNIGPWIAATPRLARREIMARRYPLSAYLVRAGREVVPSVVYSHGTESSTRSAFGYHVGMTMAEWACRRMGLGPTTHAESAVPQGAAPGWAKTPSLPDLFGTHPATSELWLVEAKGSRRLGLRPRVKGAKQLDVGALVPVPHQKVLCGTSLERRLFMMIDVEGLPKTGNSGDVSVDNTDEKALGQDGVEGLPKTGNSGDVSVDSTDEEALVQDDEALLELARSRMLTYLVLTSLPRDGLRITAVGKPEEGSAARGDLIRLLESDRATTELRRHVPPDAGDEAVRQQNGLDMLTGRLPGTDLMLGMSRRLYGACRALAYAERRVVARVREERPKYLEELPREVQPVDGTVTRMPERQMSDRVYEERIAEVQEYVREVREEQRDDQLRSVRDGFTMGDSGSWMHLIDLAPRLALPREEGFLEAATADTYLAVEEEALDLDDEAE